MYPKVSILIAAYNAESYILDALKSITNQTYKNIEVIVVTNGCSDRTVGVVNTFIKNNDFIKLTNIEKKGKNNAYNIAYKNSTGEFITYFAADDIYEVDAIEKRLLAIKDHRNCFATCCLQSFSNTNRFDGIKYPKNPLISNYSGGSLFFSREMAEIIFPLPKELPNEDTFSQAVLRLFYRNVHVSEYLYKYRIHENNSFSSNISFKKMKEGFLIRMSAFQIVYNRFNHSNFQNTEYFYSIKSTIRCLDFYNNYGYVNIFDNRVELQTKLIFLANTNRFFYYFKNIFKSFFSGLFKQI